MSRITTDIRPEERRLLVAMTATLAAIIAGHTMLETARDTLFLVKLPADRLVVVYLILAGLSLVLSRVGTWLSQVMGRRAGLALTLVASSFVASAVAIRSPTTKVVYGFYVATGVIATLTTLQFWLVAGEQFTVAQGKRLFGYLASGGVLGAVAGALLAALLLRLGRVTTVIGAGAGLFFAAAMLVAFVLPFEESVEPTKGKARAEREPGSDTVSFPRLLMAMVALSTAALLVSDYLFKSSSAAALPAGELGKFLAMFYATTNVASLLVQLGLTGPLIRRLGVPSAILLVPLLIAGASGMVLLTGSFVAVLLLKAIDGALRHSLHRVTSELLLLPLSRATRDRVKTLNDTVFSRGVQAFVAIGLFGLGMTGMSSSRLLASLVCGISVVWFTAAFMARKPYVEIFRSALSLGRLSKDDSPSAINLASLESLMEALSSRDEGTALAAIDILSDRPRLMPALVLRHPSDLVLLRALPIVATADRTDWLGHIEDLLNHPSAAIRSEALRATAAAGRLDVVARGLKDPNLEIRTIAAFFSAWTMTEDPVGHPAIQAILESNAADGPLARRQLLEVVAAHGNSRHRTIVLVCAQKSISDKQSEVPLAKAVQATGESRLIHRLIDSLDSRLARPSIRLALGSLGNASFDALCSTFTDSSIREGLRTHIPRSLMHFHSQRSVDFLTQVLTTEKRGRTRFKTLRALNHLSAVGLVSPKLKLSFDKKLFEREALKNLSEYCRMRNVYLALGRNSDAGPTETPVRAALLALLNDKMDQALERTFRCLGLAHRGEDLHGVHLAIVRGDRRVKANAAEFLDALPYLVVELREALRIIVDEQLDDERERQALLSLGITPIAGHDEACRLLLEDPDELLAALAAHHVLETGLVQLAVEARSAILARPQLGRLGADRESTYPEPL